MYDNKSKKSSAKMSAVGTPTPKPGTKKGMPSKKSAVTKKAGKVVNSNLPSFIKKAMMAKKGK